MNQREKILAALFGLVILFWWGKPVYDRWFVEPVVQKKAQLQTLTESVETLELRDMQLLAAQARVVNATRIALPPEELIAQRLYQEWVTELAHLYRFQDLKVKPEGRSSRGKVYTSVRVSLTAKSSYEQICRFLMAFENANILHRISAFRLDCETHRGNPLVDITLSADALSMPGSQNRDTIFPRYKLQQPLSQEAVNIAPKQTEGFPIQEEFLVRIGNELIRVNSESAQQWSLERGFEGTIASPHLPGTEVELFALRTDRPLISEQQIQKIVADNFFLKPSPPIDYQPHWNDVGNQVAVRGTPLKIQLKAEGFSPDTPERTFMILGNALSGMELNAQSGELSWSPDEEVELGDYPLKLAVQVKGEETPRFEEELVFTLRDPNFAPELTELPPQTLLPGTEFQVQIEAFDLETPSEELTFLIQEDLPPGASFEGTTGLLTWTPPLVAQPEDLELTVTVTDQGVPPESASRKFQFSILEDFTRDTFLTGIIKPDDDLKAMFYNRADNETTMVHEGDEFDVAGVQGVVLMIGRDFVLWQSGELLWQLKLGQNLFSRSQADIPGAE